MKKLTVYTDGASRGNPGPAASAWLILEGTDVLESNSLVIGRATNNIAEYLALISALKAAVFYCKPAETSLSVYSDSELMIKHLNNIYACKSESLLPLYNTVRSLEKNFASVKYSHVVRENGYISSCDWLCNRALDAAKKKEPVPVASGPAAVPQIICTPVGFVRSPYLDVSDAPKQGFKSDKISRVEIKEEYRAGLEGLKEGDDIFVLCWFDKADRTVLQVHPHGNANKPLRGVFSTRAPVRPNPVSLTRVSIEKIDGPVLFVKGLDAVDMTPVLDIKPCFTQNDTRFEE